MCHQHRSVSSGLSAASVDVHVLRKELIVAKWASSELVCIALEQSGGQACYKGCALRTRVEVYPNRMIISLNFATRIVDDPDGLLVADLALGSFSQEIPHRSGFR